MKITKTNTLTPELERELHALEAICKDEGQAQAAYLSGELNFDNLPYIYLAHDENQALVGFVCIFMPVKDAEICAYTRPDARGRGVFKALIGEVERDMKAAGLKRMLFQIEPCAKTARRVLDKMYKNATLDRTEYTMHCPREGAAGAGTLESGISYVRVTRENLKAYCQLSNEAFNDDDSDEDSEVSRAVCDNPERMAYLAINAEGEALGEVGVAFESENGEKQSYIYGLCVKQNARCKGLGRALLCKGLELSFADKAVVRAKLDVETNNLHALNLYKSCGFLEVCTVEYWAKEL